MSERTAFVFKISSRLFFVLCLFFFHLSFLLAQSSWFPQTSGDTGILLRVHFTDDNTGYIVSFCNTVCKLERI